MTMCRTGLITYLAEFYATFKGVLDRLDAAW
jgi:hypothetical protein